MVSRLRRKASLRWTLYGLLLFGLALVGWRVADVLGWGEDTSNYQLVFTSLAGWEELPPQVPMLYCFRDPQTGIEIRGGQSQVVDRTSFIRGQTAADLAAHYVDTTTSNMAGWTASRMGVIESPAGTFHLIDRGTPLRRVITAFLTKGNSTFMITMVADAKAMKHADQVLPQFKEFLHKMRLEPKLYDDV